MRWEITKNPFEQIESGALATYSPDNNFRDRTRESSLQQKLKSWFFEIKEVSLREKNWGEKENDLDMWSGYHLTNLCNTKSRIARSRNVLQAHHRRVSIPEILWNFAEVYDEWEILNCSLSMLSNENSSFSVIKEQ